MINPGDLRAGTVVRYKARETLYEIVSTSASLQCSTAPDFEKMFESEDWVVYRNVSTHSYYVRLYAEFCDGRFEVVPQ